MNGDGWVKGRREVGCIVGCTFNDFFDGEKLMICEGVFVCLIL